MINEAYIYDSIRTPRGKRKNGSLNEITPTDLLSKLMLSLSKKNDLDTSCIDDVVVGCVMPVGDQGANLGKTAAQYAGWDIDVPGMQINRCCGSGLEAINIAAMKIRSGWENLIIAGGIESMSRVPMGSDLGSMAYEPKVSFNNNYVPQGIGADLIATIDGFSRKELDDLALQSQKRAFEANQKKRFRSMIPIYDQNGILLLDNDEHIRSNCSINDLSKLEPAFAKIGKMGFDEIAKKKYPQVEKIHHHHTAGNSSGIVDGASLAIIGSKSSGQELGLKPRAVIRSVATCSTDPTIMLAGPAPATVKALNKAKMNTSDIDLFEVNEAFAAVVLRFMNEMNLNSMDNINVNGGSIAMGHPLGATGSILLGTLLDELENRDQTVGLVTLCVAGGMGIATIIERI